MDNWHDYRVESRREIVVLLRQIQAKKQLIRMLVKGEADVCVTTLLDVDADAGTIVLDRSPDPAQNRRALSAIKLGYETTLDKIRILFNTEELEEVDFEGGPAFIAALPESLIRLQRREYYRMPTPVSNPVMVSIALPLEQGGGSAKFPIADISVGGISILDNKLQLGNTIGAEYPNCRLDLPDVGVVTCTLQVRNSIDLTLLNSKTNRRLGCQFANMSRAGVSSVQRYITHLERERNARAAGLG
ncbi:MAG TPA: flagellar brake protein [Telluria sp.]|jgi:c-di-GMP-binding flagellar brake protein YcgR